MKARINTKIQTRDCIVLRELKHVDGSLDYEVEAIGGESLYAGPGKAKALRVFVAHRRMLKSRAKAAVKSGGDQ